MDPDAALKRIRELCCEIDGAEMQRLTPEMAAELASLVRGLDEWLSNGGFLPAGWRQKRP